MTDIYRGTELTVYVSVHHPINIYKSYTYIYDTDNGVSTTEFPLNQIGLNRFPLWAMHVR